MNNIIYNKYLLIIFSHLLKMVSITTLAGNIIHTFENKSNIISKDILYEYFITITDKYYYILNNDEIIYTNIYNINYNLNCSIEIKNNLTIIYIDEKHIIGLLMLHKRINLLYYSGEYLNDISIFYIYRNEQLLNEYIGYLTEHINESYLIILSLQKLVDKNIYIATYDILKRDVFNEDTSTDIYKTIILFNTKYRNFTKVELHNIPKIFIEIKQKYKNNKDILSLLNKIIII